MKLCLVFSVLSLVVLGLVVVDGRSATAASCSSSTYSDMQAEMKKRRETPLGKQLLDVWNMAGTKGLMSPKVMRLALGKGMDSVPKEVLANVNRLFEYATLALDNGTACVMKCGGGYNGVPINFTKFGCDQVQTVVDCLKECPQGAVSTYTHALAKHFADELCPPNTWRYYAFTLDSYVEAIGKRNEKCWKKVESDDLEAMKVVQHFIGCYLKMEQAASDEETCYSLKNCAIDGTAEFFNQLCGEGAPTFGQLMKYTAIFQLSLLSTNGTLGSECPALYEVDF